jgi:hypothetical protein
MYTSYRSCLITVLKLPTHVFEEAILKTSKLHNLFIQYPNNTYFIMLESFENGAKTRIFFGHFNNSN